LWLAAIHAGERIIVAVVSLGKVLVVAGAVAYSISEMAGKSTDFNSVISWSARVNASEWVAWGAAGTASLALLREKRARKKMTAQAGARMSELEQIADPGRTSSGMGPDGGNPPGDVI
jgi:hypothetical protein